MEGDAELTPYRRLEFENDKEQLENIEIGIINKSRSMDPIELKHLDSNEILMNTHSVVPINLIPKLGMEFETEEEALEFYRAYAKEVGFGIRRSKSYNDKFGKMISRLFCCSAEGKRMPDRRDIYVKAHRAETRCGCEAKMKITRLQTRKFQVVQFVEEHNHYLSSPNKTHLHRSHRKISYSAAIQIQMANDVGIAPKASHDLMVKQVGGRDNLGFIPEDYKNYLRSKRTIDVKKGDTGGVLEYLHKMQFGDPNFFYAIQVDEDDLITNIFWSDVRMKNDYSDFGDVCFDTTYRKNSEGRPLALFVGVNHHKQTIMFGAALLYDETALTFEWLFDTFARAMFEKKPKTILTDQDAAMAKALTSKWPETHHRLCIWHIYQNAAIHLSGVFSQFKDFSRDFSSCIYDFDEEEDFLVAWDEMLLNYELQDNGWLKRLFNIKEKWALVYGRFMFCADMTTTQRSESMNSIVKRYVSYQHNFLQFFSRFDKLIDDRRYNELIADFRSNTSTPALVAPVQILKHASSVYTPEIFKCFQDEWKKSHDFGFKYCGEFGPVSKYEITSVNKRHFYSVTYDSSTHEVYCSCRKFEFAGILCSHVLKVFSIMSILRIPSQYILKRWTRKAKTGYIGDKSTNVNESELDPKMLKNLRYKKLCAIAMRLVTRASERSDTYKSVENCLLSRLKVVDEMLQNEELVVENNSVLSNKELVQCSNAEANPSNQIMNFGERNTIRGVKVKTKVVSGKRLKGALEKSLKKRKSVQKSQTSAISTNSITHTVIL